MELEPSTSLEDAIVRAAALFNTATKGMRPTQAWRYVRENVPQLKERQLADAYLQSTNYTHR